MTSFYLAMVALPVAIIVAAFVLALATRDKKG